MSGNSEQMTYKKAREGNKSNTSEALTDDEVNILYEKYLHLGFWRVTKCLHSVRIKTVDICSAEWRENLV